MTVTSTLYLLLALLPTHRATPVSGATTICLVPASTQMATNNAAEAMKAVRETFTSFLTGPTLTLTPLNARLAGQARLEAKQAGCGYVLFVTLKHERKSSDNRLLGRVVGSAAQQGAYAVGGSAGSVAARVAANAVASAAAAAAADLATSTKTRDELELSYRLENIGGQTVAEKSAKRKANSDGEDLLTPLVEQASEQIASAAK